MTFMSVGMLLYLEGDGSNKHSIWNVFGWELISINFQKSEMVHQLVFFIRKRQGFHIYSKPRFGVD